MRKSPLRKQSEKNARITKHYNRVRACLINNNTLFLCEYCREYRETRFITLKNRKQKLDSSRLRVGNTVTVKGVT